MIGPWVLSSVRELRGAETLDIIVNSAFTLLTGVLTPVLQNIFFFLLRVIFEALLD